MNYAQPIPDYMVQYTLCCMPINSTVENIKQAACYLTIPIFLTKECSSMCGSKSCQDVQILINAYSIQTNGYVGKFFLI